MSMRLRKATTAKINEQNLIEFGWLVVCTFLIRRTQIRKSWRFLLLGYEESTSAHINDLHIRILIWAINSYKYLIVITSRPFFLLATSLNVCVCVVVVVLTQFNYYFVFYALDWFSWNNFVEMFVRFWSFLNFYSLVSIVITDKIIALAILIYRFCLQCSMQWFFFFCLCAVVVIKFGCFLLFFFWICCVVYFFFLCVNSLQLMNQNVLADWFFFGV